MTEDACEGRAPILPCLEVPKVLTEKKVLAIHKKAQELEIQKVGKRAWRGATQKDLENLISVANAEGLKELLGKAGLTGPGVVETYQSVEETYARVKDSDYAKQKETIDVGYQERMIQEIVKRM